MKKNKGEADEAGQETQPADESQTAVEQQPAAVSQWRFELNQQVKIAGSDATGQVMWRRESQSDEREYLVNSGGAPDTWIAEGDLASV
jgi:hypothetical protein